VIVVIGSPSARPTAQGVGAVGLAATVAQAAVALGSAVQLVGRVGEDPAGDGVLLALAATGVEHVAVLREPTRLTPSVAPPGGLPASPDGPILGETPSMDETLSDAMLDDTDGDPEADPADASAVRADANPDGLPLDAADLELALRYLPDYRVVVLAVDLDSSALATVVGAAGWAGAHLIALVTGAAASNDLPPDATVLERPATDPDGAFARVVAAYAAALDQGREPRAAFDEASGGAGWAAVPN
jgi:hypothetical protein